MLRFGSDFCAATLQVLLRLFPQPMFRNIALQCLAEASTVFPLCTCLCTCLCCPNSPECPPDCAASLSVLLCRCPSAWPQIAALQVGPEYNSHFANLYKFFLAQVRLSSVH